MLPPRPRLVPEALALPLRDAMRGVRTAAEYSEGLLAPAVALLPGPLQRLLRETVETAEKAGQRRIDADAPTPQDMAAVTATLAGAEGAGGAGEPFARVLAFGLEKALDTGVEAHLMISETLAALAVREALREVPPGADAADRAARLALQLSRSHVAGRVPGTGLALDADDLKRIDVALAAVFLWLLAERPEAPGEEERLLEIAVGLAQATEAVLRAASASPESLAAELRQLAAML